MMVYDEFGQLLNDLLLLNRNDNGKRRSMATRQEMHHCKTCGKTTMMVRNPPNHALHLILSILTLGFWIFPWILFAIFQPSPRCTVCDTLM